MRAMRRGEGIVAVDVADRRQPPREPLVVLLLAGVEAQVLEQKHIARRHLRHSRAIRAIGEPYLGTERR